MKGDQNISGCLLIYQQLLFGFQIDRWVICHE